MRFLRLIQFALILLMLFWFTAMLISGEGTGQSMDAGLLILEGAISGLVTAIVVKKIIESGPSPSLSKFAVAMVVLIFAFAFGWSELTLVLKMHDNPNITFFWRTLYCGYGCFLGWFLVIMAATLGRLLGARKEKAGDDGECSGEAEQGSGDDTPKPDPGE